MILNKLEEQSKKRIKDLESLKVNIQTLQVKLSSIEKYRFGLKCNILYYKFDHSYLFVKETEIISIILVNFCREEESK